MLNTHFQLNSFIRHKKTNSIFRISGIEHRPGGDIVVTICDAAARCFRLQPEQISALYDEFDEAPPIGDDWLKPAFPARTSPRIDREPQPQPKRPVGRPPKQKRPDVLSNFLNTKD
jgi:hypothetical protein